MPFLCGQSRKPDEDHATTPHKTSAAPSSPHETSTTPSCQVTDSSTTDDASIPIPSHDASPSILHRLPLDLLYYLTTHHLSADAADVLALSATSRAFRTPLLLTPTTGPATAASSVSASRSFLKRLNYDRFTRACAAERLEQPQPQQQQANNNNNNNNNSEQQRPCSACVSIHPPSLFSAAQLARAPEQRRCKGADGVVRMCQHMALTYDEVASAVAAAASNRELSSLSSWFLSRWQCHDCAVEAVHDINADSSGYHYCRKLWVRSAELIIYSGRGIERCFGPWAQVRVVVAVGEVQQSGSLTRERVLGVLAAVEEETGVVVGCRHVRFGDPRTFRTRLWSLGDAGGARSGRILISSHECLEPGCYMMAYLFWKRSRLSRDTAPDSEAVVELEITRHLGLMRSPSSERWLAQIEEEGTVGHEPDDLYNEQRILLILPQQPPLLSPRCHFCAACLPSHGVLIKKQPPKPDKGHAIYSNIDAASSHNVEHSILHRFPLDLLYYLVRNYLSDDTSDILALRATSRAFRILFISIESQFINDGWAAYLFSLRLRDDRFTRACAAEEQWQQQRQQQRSASPPLLRYLIGSSSSSKKQQQQQKSEKRLEQRACARCHDTHPRWRFSAAQLARAPTERRCKVIARMCPHWKVRYDLNESGRRRITRQVVLLRLLMWSQRAMCDPRAERQELEWLAAGVPPWSHISGSSAGGSIHPHGHYLP